MMMGMGQGQGGGADDGAGHAGDDVVLRAPRERAEITASPAVMSRETFAKGRAFYATLASRPAGWVLTLDIMRAAERVMTDTITGGGRSG